MKILLLLLCAVILILGAAGIAMAISIEFIEAWYPIASEPRTMLVLGSSLIGLAGFLRKKFKK